MDALSGGMGPVGETIRAFVAVNVPEGLRAALAQAQRRLKGVPADVSWVAPGNIHLTLKFLGEVGESGVARVGQALEAAAAAHAPFTVTLGGFGVFPPQGPPRVLWAGVQEGAEALAALHASVERALAPLRFPGEGRRFTAHLTIGRIRSPRNVAALADALRGLGGEPLGTFRLEAIDLMRSQLHPRGSVYTVLRRLPLTGASGPAT